MNVLISMEELSKLLDVKTSWIKSMVFKKQIPFIKLGKHVRFCPRQIQSWIEARKMEENSWN
jgi:excisionase family DNA binding protein